MLLMPRDRLVEIEASDDQTMKREVIRSLVSGVIVQPEGEGRHVRTSVRIPTLSVRLSSRTSYRL